MKLHSEVLINKPIGIPQYETALLESLSDELTERDNL